MVRRAPRRGLDPAQALGGERPRRGASSNRRAHTLPCRHRPQRAHGRRFPVALSESGIRLQFGVGYDHIDASWAGEHGLIVTHTPGVLDAEVADIAMALTLAAVRNLPQAERYLREGHWLSPLSAHRFFARPHMGILGLGRIGREIARRALAFGLESSTTDEPATDAPYLYYPTLKGMAAAATSW